MTRLAKIRRLLDQAPQSDPLVQAIRLILEELEAAE